MCKMFGEGQKKLIFCAEQLQVIVAVVFYDTLLYVQLVITIFRWTETEVELKPAS